METYIFLPIYIFSKEMKVGMIFKVNFVINNLKKIFQLMVVSKLLKVLGDLLESMMRIKL